MNTLLLIVLGLLGWGIWGSARWARGAALGAPGLRPLLLWGGLLASPLGIYVALFLPEQLEFNRESPAGIFYVYLPCFLAGGVLFAGGIGGVVGALRAKVNTTND